MNNFQSETIKASMLYRNAIWFSLSPVFGAIGVDGIWSAGKPFFR
jgi:hypothetical protein